MTWGGGVTRGSEDGGDMRPGALRVVVMCEGGMRVVGTCDREI